MRRQRFSRLSLVEAAILGLIAILVVGVGIAAGGIQREQVVLGASAASSASPAGAAIPAVGDVIPLPFIESGEITLVRTDKPPAFSGEEAVRIVRAFGVPDGEVVRGDKPVTCSATYGLGTLGRSGGPGLPWWGPRNVPLKGTDVILDHVENRPMWIVDCDNAYAATSSGCPGCETPYFKHAVYPVDEQTRSVMMALFFGQVPSNEVPNAPGA